MTEEVVVACEAAHEVGADEIVVKYGHGDASNIDPPKMPEYVTLIRGKSGHPYNMMYGIDDSYDGVLYLGYHAPAGDPNFSISRTSTGNSLYIHLNGKVISEIREGVKKAVAGQKKEYTMSFYPGMQKVDTFTNKLETDCWMDIATAHCFVVY